jgi:hypothetical protein
MTQSQRAGSREEAIRAAYECGECGRASNGSAGPGVGASQSAADQRKKLPRLLSPQRATSPNSVTLRQQQLAVYDKLRASPIFALFGFTQQQVASRLHVNQAA